VGPWPHPGIPYPTWSLHKAESRLRHPNQSFASRVGQARGRFVLSAMTLRTLRTILILALGTSFLKTPEALQYSETAVDSAIPGPGVRKRLMIKPGYGATFRAEGSTHTGWGTAPSEYTAIGATTSLGCLTIRRGRGARAGFRGRRWSPRSVPVCDPSDGMSSSRPGSRSHRPQHQQHRSHNCEEAAEGQHERL